MYVHLTAQCRRFLFNDPRIALYAWCALRAAFPDAIAACIMGNHIHLVVWVADPEVATRQLAYVIAGITRVARIESGWWSPIKPAAPIADVQKLEAQVRYVVLNPCRGDLTRDPLTWPWTTHRDVVGAVFDPWVSAERLAEALEQPTDNFIAKHHYHVSNDTKAKIGGTPPPIAAATTTVATYPLARIAGAACAATRSPTRELHTRKIARKAFVLLAFDQGWTDARQVGAACGVSAGSVRRIVNQPDESLLSAARLTVADDRLRVWPG